MVKRYRKMAKKANGQIREIRDGQAVLESECERIAGVKNSKNPMRQANWWGSQLGAIYYGKQKVLITVPDSEIRTTKRYS